MWKRSALPFLIVALVVIWGEANAFVYYIPKDPKVDENEILRIRHLDTPQFIEYFGYPSETHEVITEDGYILQLDRIPHGREGNTTIKRPAVFIQHGIFSYSRHFLAAGPKKALGFILADNGYDVWLGNARGTCYSRNHTHLNPDNDMEFWDYSWHDIGYFDIPAIIDHILAKTKEQKLSYIGHSQGTTVYYVMMSERPEYAEKIQVQFSLAPVAYLNKDGLIVNGKLEPYLEMALDILNIHEISNKNLAIGFIIRNLCTFKYFNALCVAKAFNSAGYDYPQFNISILPIISYNYPVGSSTKQVKHFLQEMATGEFRQFDYGHLVNYLRYNTTIPPKYNIKNVTPPTHLMYSKNDLVSVESDVDRLYNDLPEGNKYKYLVPYEHWSHLDYLVGTDAKFFVYDYILDHLKQYRSS